MKKFIVFIGCLFISVSVFSQAKIPAEFWTFPMKGINPILAELYAATQGGSIAPFNIDPTPDILFNKMDFQTISQMDGTTIKTVKGKTTLVGNTVSIELLTYNGSTLILKSTISILCNLQAKSNALTRLQIVGSSGSPIDISVTSYDMYNDSQAASDLAQFFTVWGKFFNIWYSKDTITQYLRQ
jgi:hypothetical protein